jgi:hypothetical protein
VTTQFSLQNYVFISILGASGCGLGVGLGWGNGINTLYLKQLHGRIGLPWKLAMIGFGHIRLFQNIYINLKKAQNECIKYSNYLYVS